MNKKRTLLTAVALILVCVLSVMGTVAYLKDTTTTVTNTFVAAGGPGPFVDEDEHGSKKFELLEYEVTQSSTGKYTLNKNKEVAANRFDVMPGTTIPKQVFVKLSRTGAVVDNTPVAPAPAYLYLEVFDGLNESEYTWSVDATNWQKLGSVAAGEETSDIYLYIGAMADSNHVLTTVAANTQIDVITGNKVEANDVTLTEGEFNLTFNAYLSQASTGETDDPAEVFKNCFGKTITPVASEGA